MAKEHECVGAVAVKQRTGNTRKQRFAVLDRDGACGLDHKAIVALLVERYELTGWWQQMITVADEQERGLRMKAYWGRGLERLGESMETSQGEQGDLVRNSMETS